MAWPYPVNSYWAVRCQALAPSRELTTLYKIQSRCYRGYWLVNLLVRCHTRLDVLLWLKSFVDQETSIEKQTASRKMKRVTLYARIVKVWSPFSEEDGRSACIKSIGSSGSVIWGHSPAVPTPGNQIYRSKEVVACWLPDRLTVRLGSQAWQSIQASIAKQGALWCNMLIISRIGQDRTLRSILV
jgi:hypothetical protein